MDQDRFEEISTSGIDMVVTCALATKGFPMPGSIITYSAFLDDLEVVVLGYHLPDPGDPGHTRTKPVAIFVDEAVFDRLRVEESGRWGADGVLRLVGDEKPPGASMSPGGAS